MTSRLVAVRLRLGHIVALVDHREATASGTAVMMTPAVKHEP
jgi:hypothetical protein